MVREGGPIPHKQAAVLFAALGRGEEVAQLNGRLADLLNNSAYVVSAWDGAALGGAALGPGGYPSLTLALLGLVGVSAATIAWALRPAPPSAD